MHSTTPLTAANLHFLQQGVDLLEGLSDERYTTPPPSIPMSPVGGHLRHCLDFYACFLAGLEAGRVDYDTRCRNPRIETDRIHALGVLRSTMDRLSGLVPEDDERPLAVANDRAPGEEGSLAWARSTVRRELQFLRSHTVHHYALIGAVLRLLGHDVPPDFGVAPSTLTYREKQARVEEEGILEPAAAPLSSR